MTTDPVVTLTALRKTYQPKSSDPKDALQDVDLTIPRGSIFGLLGPNGAGKSTLINILGGLTLKSSGTVNINGFDLDTHPRDVRRMLGIVPQEVVLDPFFSIRETLEYYAGYYGIPPKNRQTDALLNALALTDKAHLNSRRLSGGMKRRVLIAKALVHRPPVLVLDEPTAGVDVELRRQLWDYVRELNRQGTTVLLTTHYLEEAEELCDYVAIINHGKIIANDSTRALLQLMDSRQVILRFDRAVKAQELPQPLQTYAPEQREDNVIAITFKSGELTITDILNFTHSANLGITDLTTREPDLEDTFRHLINQ